MAETMVASPVKTDHSSRKNKKPLMEKRRRARINSCLSQLKSLVLQAIKKDSSQFSKLEKADILELTVKHLRNLQRQQAAGVLSQDTHVVSKYRAGFNECAKEVVRYMGSVREVHEEVKERVVSHLANCLQVVNQITPMESMAQQQQQMKPLHVHIPPQQPINGAVTTAVAPSVIMHTAAVSQASLVQSGLGGCYSHGHNHPSPLRSSSTSSASSSSSLSQDSHHHHHLHQAPSPVSSSSSTAAPPHPPHLHAPLTALPLQSVAAAMTTVGTAVVPSSSVPPTTSPPAISGAFKLVPSGAGTVAVYVGTADSVPRAPDTVSVDAVPLYSVSLPPHPHHHHPQQHPNTALAAFVTPTSHITSAVAATAADSSPRYEDVSPVKAEYSPLSAAAAASLPVDLRQTAKLKVVEEVGDHCPSLSAGHCSPALAHDDKLWRPW